MSALIQKIVGSLLRLVLGGVVGWLIEQGVMHPDQEAAFYGALVTAVVAVLWAVWQNVFRQRVQNTLAGVPPVAVEVVEAMVKSGVFAPATTPKTNVPKVPEGPQ